MRADLGAIAAFIMALMPVIDLVVRLIEKILAGKTGEEKKAAATEYIQRTWTPDMKENVLLTAALSSEIDAYVGLLGQAKEFAHAGQLRGPPDIVKYGAR